MRSIILVTAFLATFCRAQEPQWELFNDTYSAAFYWKTAIAVDPNNSKTIYIDGRYKTTDGGATWDTIGTGLKINADALIVDNENPGVLWAGGPESFEMGIGKSIDGGLNWVKSDSGIALDFHGYEIEGMEIDRTRNILYAYDPIVPVYKSTDGGTYWQNIGSNVPGGDDLAVDEDDGVLYFGANGVWKKELEEELWTQVSDGLPKDQFGEYLNVKQIAAVMGSSTLYCVVDTVPSGAIGQRVYKSYNNGGSWLPLGLTVYVTTQLTVSDIDTNLIILSSEAKTFADLTLGGVNLSYDGGLSWELYNCGLPGSPSLWTAWNMTYDQNSNSIYAYLELFYPGSSTKGIYKLSLDKPTSINTDNKTPEKFSLKQNYPNPFNSNTIIQYKLTKSTNLKLIIYDIQGKEVITLINKTQQPGSYSIRWNGNNSNNNSVTGGIYFYRLLTGRETLTRKMVYIP